MHAAGDVIAFSSLTAVYEWRQTMAFTLAGKCVVIFCLLQDMFYHIATRGALAGIPLRRILGARPSLFDFLQVMYFQVCLAFAHSDPTLPEQKEALT
jgi:hypothetical protein